jgi:hypothetical protein
MKLINLSLVLAAVIAASTTTTADALTSKPTDRRKVFGQLLAGGIAGSAFLVSAQPASAVTMKTGGASPFTGDYNDPNHPDCLRQVKVVGSPLKGDGTRSPYPIIEVTGYDGKSSGSNICTDRPTRDDLWKVEGTVKSTDTAVSFVSFFFFCFCCCRFFVIINE